MSRKSARKRKSTEKGDYDYSGQACPPISPSNPSIFSLEECYDAFLQRDFTPLDKEDPDMSNPTEGAEGASSSTPKIYKQVYVTDLPCQTSSWTDSTEQIEKMFKIRTCSFDLNTLFWPDSEEGTNLGNWFEHFIDPRPPSVGAVYEEYFRYLDSVLSSLDIDVFSWFRGKGLDILKTNSRRTFATISNDLKNFDTSCIPAPRRAALCEKIVTNKPKLMKWLTTLKVILEKQPKSLCEKSFEECFRDFVEIADLYCHCGEIFSTFRFSYNYTTCSKENTVQISSEPDLLMYTIDDEVGNQNCVAVVEVKVDKDVKTMPTGDSSPCPLSSAEGVSNECMEESDKEEQMNIDLLKREYVNGNPKVLTKMLKDECGKFLLQLLGEVAAVTNSQILQFKEVLGTQQGHRSVLGIGVIGFKVYFVNFICVTKGEVVQKDWSVHHIPVMRGIGLDLLVSEPLDMLKRADRNTLIRALCAIRTLKYSDWVRRS